MQKMQKCKNDQPYVTFGGFLKLWGSRWRLLEAILGDLGHKLGDLGGYVGLCWRILAKRWAMFGHLGAMLRHLGDKMRPKSAKMSPRWRPRQPRGANRSEKPSQLEPRGASDPSCPLQTPPPQLKLRASLDLQRHSRCSLSFRHPGHHPFIVSIFRFFIYSYLFP